MARATVTQDPLLTKRKKRAAIGYQVWYYLCLDCWSRIEDIARPYVERASEEVKEGDDAGVPFECHKCGAELRPERSQDDSNRIVTRKSTKGAA